MSGDLNLEKHEPIGIDSREPEEYERRALIHQRHSHSAPCLTWPFSPMPTCFTMVASLSRSNCPLSAFRRMAKTRKTAQPEKPPARGSVPLEYLAFCVRGKFCHLAQGNRGLIVVKGSDQRKMFGKLGLFTINLEMLPHFRDLNDRTLLDHLHDEVHEDFDISECTIVKSYRFARYLQHFNKLQAECKRQKAHLVE
ncbi:hypothetical protein TNCV_4961071 [Trichonephila clavipes]|uniref:Uncharacterized protein n=1 Tax=Trichonephila clavipes TaxID=2585209 RepID=A0A8X6SR70_TRICX|nr:hypothetical protein TNCV_4961071 [Trichonephila clavipes]